MSDTPTPVSDAAGRYATALFELARDEDKLDQTERDLNDLDETLKSSDDLRRVIQSPIYAADDKAAGLNAVADKMGLSDLTRNMLGLMGRKGRVHLVPGVIEMFGRLMAEHRGEITAEVTAARELTDAQADELKQTLSTSEGRDVKLNVTVDESLIGGLIVKVGSRMIDTSIRSRLAALQNAMKEAG